MGFVSDWKPALAPLSSALTLDDVPHRGRYYSFAIAAICISLVTVSQLMKARKLNVDVPLEGASGIVSSYLGAYGFIKNMKTILRQAYKKYNQGTFKVSGLDRYTVVLNRRDLIDEVRQAPDDQVSLSEAMVDILASRWTVGENMETNHYHANIIRNQLTRSLNGLFDDIRDEITQAFNDLIPAENDEWVAVPALEAMKSIVCRISNRVFVGTPLCRDPDYIDLNISFTVDVTKTLFTISKVPVLLRRIIGAFITTSPRNIRRGMKHLRPLLEERFRLYDENGNDWPDKPNDMLSWLIDEAPENEKRSVYELTKRMLFVNFTAIHTSSNVSRAQVNATSDFQPFLYFRALPTLYSTWPPNQSTLSLCDKEVEQVIKEEGWTKVAMTKMWKLDSFMKESQRMNGIHLLTLNRKVMSDFTLSDGTFLPTGTFLAANIAAAHNDEAYYPNADKFDGFRFSNMREESTEGGVKHQMVNTSSDYLAFGHGRHACPGRFFAVNELKTMMAYLLLTYDLKAEVEGVRPENVYMGIRLSPDPKAKVLLKKRANA